LTYVEFLARLAVDVDLMAVYLRDPGAVMAALGVVEEQRDALLKADVTILLENLDQAVLSRGAIDTLFLGLTEF
jgi:hypothetical protein